MNVTFSRTCSTGIELYVYVRGQLVWKRWGADAWMSSMGCLVHGYSKLFQKAPCTTEILREYSEEEWSAMIGWACVVWADALRENYGRRHARERRIARRAARREELRSNRAKL